MFIPKRNTKLLRHQSLKSFKQSQHSTFLDLSLRLSSFFAFTTNKNGGDQRITLQRIDSDQIQNLTRIEIQIQVRTQQTKLDPYGPKYQKWRYTCTYVARVPLMYSRQTLVGGIRINLMLGKF